VKLYPSPYRRFRWWLVAIASLPFIVALAAWQGSSSGSNKQAHEAARPSTAREVVTLVVQDGETGAAAPVEAYRLADRAFERKFPNVKIKHISKEFTALTTTLKVQLSSSSAPDVTQTNQGYPTMGTLVKAGLLLPLDRYAAKYGWSKRQAESLLAMGRFSPDGRYIAAGKLYGISATGNLLGIYYNKAKLKRLSLNVPATFDAFERALAVAKRAGEVAIMFGNLDKWPGTHEFEIVQDAIAPKQYLRNLIFGRKGASFVTPINLRAASILQGWSKNGYLTPGFNGLGYDEAWKRFAKGEGVFLITGTWLNGDLQQTMGKNVGFFLMPRARAGAPPVATGAGGLPWGIPTKAKQPDVAAAYIDFITSTQGAELFVKKDLVPATAVAPSAAPAGSVTADALAAWRKLIKTDGFIPYLDWATPTFYDTLTAGLQELLGKRITPSEFLRKLEDDYAKFIRSR